MPDDDRRSIDRELGEMSANITNLEKSFDTLRDDVRGDIGKLFSKIDEYHQAAVSHPCVQTDDIADHESRLRSHNERISKIRSEIGGIKKVTLAITTFISMLIGALGLALKWHK